MADETPGNDTQVLLSISAVYTDVPNVVSCKPPGNERASIPTTHLRSTRHTSRAGKPKAKDAVLVINYDPGDAVHHAMYLASIDEDDRDWRTILQDDGAANVDFSGWIKDWDPTDIVVDGLVQVNVTIECNSITLTQ